MPKVLLIDDEPYVLEGLKTMVSWEEYGFEICGEAANGEDGLEIFLASRPELVITDIKMPAMDGLELIRRVREDGYSRVKFIIISGYDEFAYAQHAMRYGVSAYLLKPLDDQEIRKAMEGIMAPDSGMDPEGFFLYADPDGEVRCILFEIDNYHAWLDERTEEEISTEKERIKNVIIESLPPAFPFHLFAADSNRFSLVLFSLVFTEKRQFWPNINEYIWDLKKTLKERCQCSVSVAVSDKSKGPGALEDSFHQASLAIEHNFFQGEGSVIYFNNLKKPCLNYDFCHDSIDGLLEEIKHNRSAGIDEKINCLFHFFTRNMYTREVVKGYIENLAVEAFKLVLNTIGAEFTGAQDEIGEKFFELHKKMEHLTGEELKRELGAFCRKLAEYIDTGQENEDIIGEVKAYIKEHYNQNITLQKLAERFYIHPVYLGQLFKKSTGRRFSDYLHQIRIEQAKKMLRKTNMKVAEVARATGYCNSDYFVRKFKSIVQVSPSAYKSVKF